MAPVVGEKATTRYDTGIEVQVQRAAKRMAIGILLTMSHGGSGFRCPTLWRTGAVPAIEPVHSPLLFGRKKAYAAAAQRGLANPEVRSDNPGIRRYSRTTGKAENGR